VAMRAMDQNITALLAKIAFLELEFNELACSARANARARNAAFRSCRSRITSVSIILVPSFHAPL
jgi:hypothetical protein